jgi:hypothetical protein
MPQRTATAVGYGSRSHLARRTRSAATLIAFGLLLSAGACVEPHSNQPTSQVRANRNISPTIAPVSAAVKLRMSPDEAIHDRSEVFANGCHLTAIRTNQKRCSFGAPNGSKEAVLFGDSHAAQWFPALNALATKRGYRLYSWTKSACPWYELTIVQHRTDREYTECATWRHSMFRRLAAQSPDVIFVASIAGIYQVRRNGATLSQDQSQPLIEAAIVATLRKLRLLGSHIVFITDNPRQEGSIPECIRVHLPNLTACDIPRTRLEVTSSTDATAVRQVPGVEIADLDDRFCGPTTCPVVVNGYIVHSDRNHLTASFAKASAAWFSSHLR